MSIPPFVVMRPGLSAFLAQFSLHLQLLRVEWEQEKYRQRQMLTALLFGISFFLCTLLCLSVLVIAVGWDTPYRLPSVSLLLVVFGCGSFVFWTRLSKLMAQGTDAFADSRQEFAADFALLRQWIDI